MSSTHSTIRFLGEPTNFYGTGNAKENPESWLRTMDRIRRGAKLPDDEALLVSTHEATVETWNSFQVLFKAKYCSIKDDMAYWEEIQGVKQGLSVTIKEVASKLRRVTLGSRPHPSSFLIWILVEHQAL
ncbi:hypothetical protein BCR42DRAFT_398426 [Absidia repens]|uniref:Retrotransposon gag domain-containing protein n=1 Tax=Absidia repens TaxID=90262 RepID=A0A1X2HYD2_9FUNG|nr:hypothetical protein BCR42DRAFT_398426 [Absidia repens]